MNPSGGEPTLEEIARVRRIADLAQRYAHNRTLPAIIFLLVVSAAVVMLGVLGYLLESSLQAGQMTRVAVITVLLSGGLSALLWFRFVSGRRISRRLAERIYNGEGNVLTQTGETWRLRPQELSGVHFLLLLCMITWGALFFVRLIPVQHLQPTSAVFLVPIVSYLYAVKYRSLVSPFMLLYPALYAIHAILLAAGAPIYISGGPGGIYHTLNLIIPMLGYALVAALAGHLYSRVALRRLRALSRVAREHTGG